MAPGEPIISDIERILEQGPCLSSEVISKLKKLGISSEAARKRIERAGSNICKLRGVKFAHNQQFLYLKDQYPTPEFRQALIEAFRQTGSDYAMALYGIEARGGIVPRNLFNTFCGSPSLLKKHISRDIILSKLEELRIISIQDRQPLGKCVVAEYEEVDVESLSRIRACLLAEEIFIKAISDWMRENSLVSYKKMKLRGVAKPDFGHFAWDFTGPSYLLPLVSHTKQKARPNPGFFVGDVILGRELSDQHVQYFIRKCEILKYQKNTRPFVPFLIADSFSGPAFEIGKSKGLVFTTPRNFFNQEIAEGLKELIQTLSHAAARVIKDPAIVERIFSKLSSIEGAAGNLRGPLFELIVGYCIRKMKAGSIDIAQPVQSPKTGERTDIDVMLVKAKVEIRCYECKGHNLGKEVSLSEIEEWAEKRIPIIRDWIKEQDRFASSEQMFCFWTSGCFAKETQQYLKALKKRVKKYDIEWKDCSAVKKYIQSTREQGMIRVFNEQYARHPLSSIKV